MQLTTRSTSRVAVLSALTFGLAGSACDPEGSPPSPPPTASAVTQLLDAVGGPEALAQLESLSFTAAGDVAAEFQGPLVGDVSPINTFTTGFEYLPEGRRLRLEHTRDIEYPIEVTRTFSQVFSGDAGWTEGTEGVPIAAFAPGDMAPNKAAALTTFQALITPPMLLRRVVDGELAAHDVGHLTIDHTPYSVASVELSSLSLELHVNETTHELDRLVTTVHDTLVCDRTFEVRYDDWTELAGGLRVPAEVTVLSPEGVTLYHEHRVDIVADAELDDSRLTLPPEATAPTSEALATTGTLRFGFHHLYSNLGVPIPLPQTEIEVAELAPGVSLLLATHNTLVVEQAERLILIEAPLEEDRSAAVEAWARAQYPDKAISHVMVTHHHADHSSGIRHYAASGATVVLAASTADFMAQGVLGATCTLIPDALSLRPEPARIEPVPMGGTLTLDDAVNPVQIHQIHTEHAADMLIAYLPRLGAVFNSDLYQPFTAEMRAEGLVPYFGEQDLRDLAAGLEAFGLAPALVVGGHGGVTSIDEFNADVASLDSPFGARNPSRDFGTGTTAETETETETETIRAHTGSSPALEQGPLGPHRIVGRPRRPGRDERGRHP